MKEFFSMIGVLVLCFGGYVYLNDARAVNTNAAPALALSGFQCVNNGVSFHFEGTVTNVSDAPLDFWAEVFAYSNQAVTVHDEFALEFMPLPAGESKFVSRDVLGIYFTDSCQMLFKSELGTINTRKI
jgi:hypothetical protein